MLDCHFIHKFSLLSSNYPLWSDNLAYLSTQISLVWSVFLSSDHLTMDDFVYCEACAEKLYNEIVFTTLLRLCCQPSEFANMKQLSFCWLCLNKIHHSNLHNCTEVVKPIQTLKYNRAVLLLFRRCNFLLKNIKSIRELVMFKANRLDSRSMI